MILSSNNFTNITLADLYQSAFDFSESLLSIWKKNWKDSINFKKIDMNLGEYVGSYPLYIFQDSIEHVYEPTNYLIKQVSSSPEEAQFILSLPVGPKIPMHYIAWETVDEALAWLSHCKLKIQNQRIVKLNPKVDLFAEQVDFAFQNLVVLCYK